MTEQLPPKEKFNKAADLYIQNDYIGCVSVTSDVILLADAWFTVKQARELRDWLNKVIP